MITGLLRKLFWKSDLKFDLKSLNVEPNEEQIKKYIALYRKITLECLKPGKVEEYKLRKTPPYWFLNAIFVLEKYREKGIDGIYEIDNFSYSISNLKSILFNYSIPEKVTENISEELILFLWISTLKAHIPNEREIEGAVNILGYYGYDSKILLEIHPNLKYLLLDPKFEVSREAWIRGKITEYTITKFKIIYSLRKKISLSEINLNEICRYLTSFSELPKNKYSCELVYNTIFQYHHVKKSRYYAEGEYIVIFYDKGGIQPSFILGFNIVSDDEIFIRQIQGFKNINIPPQLNFPLFCIRFVEIFARNLGFNVVSIYGSKCSYNRKYEEKYHTNKKFQKEIEAKYDMWATQLGYKIRDDETWFKNI